MNQALLKKFILSAVLTSTLSACGGGGGSSSPAARQPDGGPVPQNYDVTINSDECMDPFPFVSNYQEELANQIRFGDATCVKKIGSFE